MKYKLRVKRSWYSTKKTMNAITSSFVWKDKQDALECKRLLEKADISDKTEIEFVEFTEEVPLCGGD